MISLALTLILIGAIDLIAGGLTAYAHPGKWKTYLALTFLLSLVASAAYYLNTSNWGISLAFMAVVFVGSSSWVIARGRSERAWLIFAVLMLVATFVVVALVIPAFAIENEITWLKAHLQRLPWKWYTDNSEGWLILLIGVLLFLGSTSNGVVRCVLQIARGDRIEESEANLKGVDLSAPSSGCSSSVWLFPENLPQLHLLSLRKALLDFQSCVAWENVPPPLLLNRVLHRKEPF